MEIKVGDKVRVREDAPRIFFGKCDMSQIELTVGVVDKDVAEIHIVNDEKTQMKAWIIPCKYLVKVEDEAKEPKPKYKAGDKVRVLGHALLEGGVFTITLVEHREKRGWMYRINTHTWYPESDLERYTEPTVPTIKAGDRVRNIESGLIGVVDNIVYRDVAWVYCMDGNRYNWKFDELEIVQPTEQTEAEKKPNIGSIKIPVEVDLTDSYWDAYAADLAKEVALKVANKFNAPEQVAEYAVSVAKAVVEGLKRK